MVALHRAGHLKHWVQQNHDSLPQKAGYPQHALNEIHGSLHDPSNPVRPAGPVEVCGRLVLESVLWPVSTARRKLFHLHVSA